MRIKENNFITILSFMVTDLKLKGNELLVYAIIYGFTQAENQRFTGSLQYLADWTNSTKQGVLKNLKSLTDKGFIARETKVINGVTFVEYYSTLFNGGVKQSLTGGIKQSLTNNNDINNTNNNNLENEPKTEKIPFSKVREKQEELAEIQSLISEYTDDSKLIEAIDSFIQYRKQKREPMSAQAVKLMLKKLSSFTVEEQIEAIETAIVSNWTGVYPKKTSTARTEERWKTSQNEDDWGQGGLVDCSEFRK